jgi:hypothetical protein
MYNKPKKAVLGLSQSLVQALSWLSLFTMFITDKVLHIVIPPLPDYWYGVVFGVAAFGKAAHIVMNRHK